MDRSRSTNRMRGCRGGLWVWCCLAGLLLAVGAPRAEQVDRVALCEGAPDCDGADIRIQADIASNRNLGFSVAMGYLDGDRFADLVVGAPGSASVYIFYGGVDNASPDETSDDRGLDSNQADLVLTGVALSQLGYSVAVAPRLAADDLNNALIIGAPAQNDDASAGAAYVIPASFFAPSRPTGTYEIGSVASVVLNGAQFGDEAGYSVALGPVRTNGADDIVVGARLANGERGAVYAVDGATVDSPVALETDADVTVTGAEEGEGVGEYLALADFDNLPDLIWEAAVGAVGTGQNETQPGRVYLLDLSGTSGTNINLMNMPGWLIEGVPGDPGDQGDLFGFALAAGDFDSSGVPDLAVGAIYADRDNAALNCSAEDQLQKNAGAVYVFRDSFLSGALLTPTAASWEADEFASVIFWGDAEWDELGFGLAAADVASDSLDHLLVTARRHDRGYEVDRVDEGAVYILNGPLDLNQLRPLELCLDCADDDCSTGNLPTSVSAMLFGGDYDLAFQNSDEVGFSIAAGDFDGDSLFDDIAVSSATHERVYVVSLENTDAQTAPGAVGQDIDDYRDIRDRDDDGDGYSDTDEDANANGVLDPDESDPYLPNRDVTVAVDPEGDLPCDDEIEVVVTVTNAGAHLVLADPRLQVTLPQELQPTSQRSVFEYVAQSTTIDGNNVDDLSPPVCQNNPSLTCPPIGNCEATVGGACTAFPFVDFRSLTASGSGPLPSPIPGSGQIVVRFRLKASLPLEDDALTTDDVLADVEPVPDELPYEHATPGLSQPNSASGTVTLLVPDLDVEKASTDIDGGELDPGDLLLYTLTISNTVPRATYDAGEVILRDAIPTDTTYQPGTITQDTGSRTDPVDADNADHDGTNPGEITVNVGTLAPGASTTITFQVQVDEQTADGTIIENFATITERCLADRVTEPPTSDQVVSRAEIELSKSADRTEAWAGEEIEYTFTLTTGGGNVRLSNIVLTDDLCQPVTPPSGNINGDEYLDWAESGDGAETWIYQCVYAVTSGDSIGLLTNTADATGDSPSGTQAVDSAGVAVDIIDPPPPIQAPDPQFLDIEGARILWSAPAAATGYHLYRGDLAAVRASGVFAQDPQTTPNAERFCWLTDTGHEDSFDPPAGQVIFYLVTADDGSVESGLGEDSEGIARTNDNPCR